MPFMRDGSQCLIADTSLQWLKDYQGSRNDLLTLRTGKAPEETMQKHQSGDPGEPQMEFKEFEPRFKFKPWFINGWFHLKLYQMFQDLSRGLI